MPLPDALIALATLGTVHSPAAPLPAPGALGELLGQVDGPPEARLLLLAGALALQENAGQRPARVEQPLPTPAPPDDRSPLPEEAARHLARMLAGEHNALLPEWLAAANAGGFRPPPELLPALLDLGRGTAELYPFLFPFLGPRAVWLAEQAGLGPWAYFRLDDVETVWQEGDLMVRVALLACQRWRDPARGRELLSSTWSSEGARQREASLRALAQGLSADDEPFLDAALDDRALGVRLAAGELLARLPGSAFVQRMAARATDRVTLQRGWRGARLVVGEQATRPDEHWDRDALPVELPRETKLDKAAWMLQQALAFVPPTFWLRRWGLKPHELLEIAQRAPEDLALPAVLGWAAARAGDRELGLLLVREALPELSPELLAVLLPQLPAPELNAALLPWLQRREPIAPEHPAYAALLAHDRPWSQPLAAAVLDAIGRAIHPAYPYPPMHTRELLRRVARCALPADGLTLVTGLTEREPEPPPGWQNEASDMLLVLEFRRRMLAALER